MKILALFLALILSPAAQDPVQPGADEPEPAESVEEIPWQDDITTATALARETGKPLLAVFR